jgi:hypothetical protein
LSEGLFGYQTDLEVLVKRRILLVGSALAIAVPFVVGIGVAGAASTATKPVVLKCHMSLSAVPPAGSSQVNQPPAQGNQYGAVHCPSIGGGVEATSFNVPDSGDTVGSYIQYFGTGSIRGKFDLTPQEGSGSLSATSFESESWVGTLTVTGGTGPYAKAAGKKGVMKCTSDDTVHLTCTEKVKLSQL